MEKKYCYPAEKLLEVQSDSKFLNKILRIFLSILRRYFKSDILIEVPKGLRNLDLDMIRLVKLVSQTQNYWNFNLKIINTPRKEPFIFCYQATKGNQILSASGNFFEEEKSLEKSLLDALSEIISSKNKNAIFVGKSLPEAETKGILKIISQKNFDIVFEKEKQISKINYDCLINQDDKISQITKRFKAYDLGLNLYLLPINLPVYQILTIIRDNKKSSLDYCFGLGCTFDMKTAILESVSNAHAKRIFAMQAGNKNTATHAGKLKGIEDGYSIDVNLFENQYFFEVLENSRETSENYYKKTLQHLVYELDKLGIKSNCREIKLKELKKLRLFGSEIKLSGTNLKLL